MAAGGGAFPVLVEGDWGCADPPKSVRSKLLCYFQSRRRSGGGECEIQLRAGRVLVCFAEEEARQRVLSKKTHELDLGDGKKLKLVVTLQETTSATEQDVSKEETIAGQVPKQDDQPKKMDVQKDLQNENITVRSRSTGEIPQHNLQASSLIVLENVAESITHEMLTLLVEPIADLSAESDFQIELISEKNVAVITFQRNTDAANFLDRCVQNRRFTEYRITARPLELTKMIKVENIPTDAKEDYITLYFENPNHGGGEVSNIQMLPEKSAIITFCDHKDVQAILGKRHSFCQQPILVYPYYISLDIVLYGKERPRIKMPEPFKIPLEPPVWQFLQTQDRLLQEIDLEMSKSYCELTWPQIKCEHPEVTMHPSVALSEQGRSGLKLIKDWKTKASSEFVCIMSKFKTAVCKIIPEAWEAVKNTLIKDKVLAIPDLSKETVVLAGFVFSVDNVKQHVDSLTKEAQRAKETIEEILSVAPGKHAVLHRLLLEKNVYKLNPGLVLSYDASAKLMKLHGMPAEVYKMKSDLLEKLHDMVEKKVDVHPHILQFLQHADGKKVSVAIFGSNKINAAYELTHESVVLVGHSPEGFLKAEEQMKKGLDHKCIALEDQEIIKKKEWKELTQQLQRRYNSAENSVIIDDCLVLGEDAKVHIAGYTKTVADVFPKLSDFVNRNTYMRKVMSAKSIGVVQYMKKENSNALDGFRKRGLNIEFGQPATCKNVILSGPKEEVLKAATEVEQMLSSVYSVCVSFDKPGVKAFFKIRAKTYIIEAKEVYNCLLRLQEDAEDSGEMNERIGHPCAEIKLKDGVVVEVHKGDLTRYPVDVVVNASNEDLKHIGGLADALSRAAGPQLQRECDDLIRKHGRLKPGRAIITHAWNLPCKQVIHAVGPRWDKSEKEKCVLLLKKAVRECLKLAETYNHGSIAIPAVSSGIFGFPLNECAHSIVTAIKEALEESSESGSLQRICLVDVADNTVQAFTDALNKVFRSEPPQSTFPDPSPMVEHSEDVRESLQTVTFSGGLKLILQHKGIEDATTDVVVSTIGTNLKLGAGPLSKALLQKAGPKLQAEFDQAIQGSGVQAGSVVQTGGHDLPCRFVLHAVLPSWDGKGNAMKKLKDIMRECLERMEELALSSVAFPAIGAGGFSFPAIEVAKVMFEEVLQFSSKKNLMSLQEVHFILHPQNKKNIEAFAEVFETLSDGNSKAEPLNDEQNTGFFGPVSTPVLGVHEMQIGSVKFHVLTGDITKENTDIIVNVTNNTFDAKSGVSKAILEGGGPQVEMECAALAVQAHSGYITTQGGNLLCKKIIHLAANSDIPAQVSQVLQECELKKHTSVAFPAIGTGQAGKAPENVANEMIDATADFVRKKSPQHLKMVKIVIFQPHMSNAFYASMKKREGVALPTSRSYFSRFKTSVFSIYEQITGKKPPKKERLLIVEKKTEVAVFEICGKTKANVEGAEKWLKELILGEQTEKHFQDVVIEMFDEAEIQKLNDLQRRLHIAIHLEKEKSPPLILVSGIPRDVMDAYTEIQKLIDTVKHDQEEKFKAQLIQKLVEWQFQSNGDNFIPFDMLTNLHLEEGKINNEKHVDIQFQGKKYQANIKKMCATDDQKRSVKIKRVEKDKLFEGLPADWEDMKGSHVKLVLLQPTSQEYQDVDAKFKSTCPTLKIEQIERVQNTLLWQSYQVQKQAMDKKHGHVNNEKILFHGTPHSTVKSINQTGFNRSYAGKNAAAIGNGTYFAVDASYSAQDAYSTPDGNGKKYMYLARVLTGDYCVGQHGQVTPPPKTPGGVDLYDSVTNSMKNPSMFVIFRDAQAYPEYLITFRN
ncbi:protein mono-ADP-ribosyltransferase PARP14 [Tiliqua scincoides]|uniref:protein mono-ADP-ribosyltransferase PARP14 n=1 Tax=Tiliqua scincoides TaxID=71010 RepID=UPI0034634B5A